MKDCLLDYHVYADDISIFCDSIWIANLLLLERVIGKILIALSSLKLNVNYSKTQCLFVKNLRVPFPENLVLDGYNIKVKDSIKLVSVVLNSTLSFCKFIYVVCASCHYQWKRISSFRKQVSLETTKLLILTFVIRRLDYCNSLFYGLPENLIEKQQSVHNKAANKNFLYENSTSNTVLLRELHWLTIPSTNYIKLPFSCMKFSISCLCLPISQILFSLRNRYSSTISDKRMTWNYLWNPPKIILVNAAPGWLVQSCWILFLKITMQGINWYLHVWSWNISLQFMNALSFEKATISTSTSPILSVFFEFGTWTCTSLLLGKKSLLRDFF